MFIGYVYCVATDKINEPKRDKHGKLNASAKANIAIVFGDATISITALIVGILGALSLIHGLPPAGAYTLIAISGAITLAWLVLTVETKGKALLILKDKLGEFLCNSKKAVVTN